MSQARGLLTPVVATIIGVGTGIAIFDPAFKQEKEQKEHGQNVEHPEQHSPAPEEQIRKTEEAVSNAGGATTIPADTERWAQVQNGQFSKPLDQKDYSPMNGTEPRHITIMDSTQDYATSPYKQREELEYLERNQLHKDTTLKGGLETRQSTMMNDTRDHTISRRKQKKNAKRLERAQSSRVRADADAAIRNSSARRLHQIMQNPERGGLTPKGAEQLRKYFSKTVPENEKLSLREMDESTAMILLQIAADVDSGGLSREEMRRWSEKRLKANRAKDSTRKGDEGGGKVEEDVEMEGAMAAKRCLGSWEEELEDDDEEQGGVVLAKEL